MCIIFIFHLKKISIICKPLFNVLFYHQKKIKMKKLMILTIALLSIIGCSKNEVEDENSLSPLANEVLKQSDFATMKQAYQTLSIVEKATIWETKFQTILKNDKQNLSKNQYDIIVLINNFLISSTFKEIRLNPEIGEKFLTDNLPYFEKYFTKVELYMLLQSPYFDETFSVKKSNLYADKLAKTEYTNAINTDPNYAPPENSCECRYNLGCPGSGNDCNTKSKCSGTRDGCGIFGTSECIGRCTLSPA